MKLLKQTKKIVKKKKSKVNFEDCRKALLVCEALYQSLKLNKSIRINFN